MAPRAAKKMTPISNSSRLPSRRSAPTIACGSVGFSHKSTRKGSYQFSARGSIAHRINGFTLLEILLVLTIIGMASVLVVPNLTGMEARTFSAQLRQANSMLNYGRRIAVVSGQASIISLNASSEQATDREQDSESSQALLNIVGQWDAAGLELRFRDSTDKEVEIEDKIHITFYPEGGSSGGTLLFFEGERQASIVIDPFTGRISSTYGED